MKYLIILLFSFSSHAGIEALSFDDAEQEQLYGKLTEELRCLVCQNQNIAGSNAELATDLRQKTFKLVKEGKQEDEIKQWMVERYGDFVLYKPPFKKETFLLWAGPAILLLIAFFVVIRIGISRNKGKDKISDSQQQEISKLIGK